MFKYRLFFFLGVFFLSVACTSTPPQIAPQIPEPEIEIIDPDFTVTSITILQSDLINTLLKLSLKIDNPNTFPVTFSSFRYDLYGNGTFWADGTEKNLAIIPPKSSVETNLECVMNFIGMNRRLLDDIITLHHVRYRISGDVVIETGIPSRPVFTMDFDHSGDSPVIE